LGKVFRPEDIVKGRKALLKSALRDLSPGVREGVQEILGSWDGVKSKKKLEKLIGEEQTSHLLRRIRSISED
jgi:hypothetical protein